MVWMINLLQQAGSVNVNCNCQFKILWDNNMSLYEIIIEEWQKLTWVGRVTWFPVFVPLLVVSCGLLLIAIPPCLCN